MTVLVVGASGAAGSKLIEQLLLKEYKARVIVRSPEKLPESWKKSPNVTIISGSIIDIPENELLDYTQGCDAVISCLGHNLTLKGIYGQPKKLVTEATRRLCNAIKANKSEQPIKYVLMNTTGNRNRDLNEPISFAQRIVIGLLRLILPPHVDNEKAADYLRTQVGQNNKYIEWVTVRPDNLVDDLEVSGYEIYPSPIRSAIFNPGKTSRINVSHFMTDLISDNDLWKTWKGQMPVIYNNSSLIEKNKEVSKKN